MAQITTVMLLARDVKQFVNSITPIQNVIQVTNLAAAVTNGDRILVATLPASARIVGAAVRVTGASGITGLAALQVVEPTGNVIFLSATTLAPSAALVALQTQPHSPIISVTATRDLEIVVASGTLSNTTANQQIIVDCNYAFFP